MWALSGSPRVVVTMMIVFPDSRLSLSMRVQHLLRRGCRSRSPVGSSATSIVRVGHDGPGYGDTLLFAARELGRIVVHPMRQG